MPQLLLQTGIGGIPNPIATALASGDGTGYGIHSEMFTTGLMRLHLAGKVTSRITPKLAPGSIVTTPATWST